MIEKKTSRQLTNYLICPLSSWRFNVLKTSFRRAPLIYKPLENRHRFKSKQLFDEWPQVQPVQRRKTVQLS